jgi:hypothetical protein
VILHDSWRFITIEREPDGSETLYELQNNSECCECAAP